MRGIVDITGEGVLSVPTSLANGLFEAHVRAHAYRFLHQLGKGHQHPLTSFFAFSGLAELSSGLFESAKTIGNWLAYVVAIWRECGTRWPEFWHAFQQDGSSSAFIAFFVQCQNVRHRLLGKLTGNDNPASRILHELAGVTSAERKPFEVDSPEFLLFEDVVGKSVSGVVETFERWQAAYHKWTRRLGLSDDALADPPSEASVPSENFLEKILELGRRDSAFSRNLAFALIALRDCNVSLEIRTSVSRGTFGIEVDSSGELLRLRPSIVVGSDVSDHAARPTILFHELGHLFLHGRWFAEYKLMRHLAKLIGEGSDPIPAAIEAIVHETWGDLPATFRSIEESADEFAATCIFPMSRIKDLKRSLRGQPATASLAIHEALALRLGLTFDGDRESDYAKRFRKFADQALVVGDERLIPQRVHGRSSTRCHVDVSMR
jgi:hypothetical protein